MKDYAVLAAVDAETACCSPFSHVDILILLILANTCTNVEDLGAGSEAMVRIPGPV